VARLLVSELVTNAVRDGRGAITLRAQMFERRLFVEVIDEGDGFEDDLRERESQASEAGGWGGTHARRSPSMTSFRWRAWRWSKR
jgi:anti-sigma regulatory factor (Ser/Thr protein kinase)